jgi:hypothetical protein
MGNRHQHKGANLSAKRFTMCAKRFTAPGPSGRRSRLDCLKRAAMESRFPLPKRVQKRFGNMPSSTWQRDGRRGAFQRTVHEPRWQRCGGKATAPYPIVNWQRRHVPVPAGAALQHVRTQRLKRFERRDRLDFTGRQKKQQRRGERWNEFLVFLLRSGDNNARWGRKFASNGRVLNRSDCTRWSWRAFAV